MRHDSLCGLTFFIPFGRVEEAGGERPLLQQVRSPFRLVAGRHVEVCQQRTINTRCHVVVGTENATDAVRCGAVPWNNSAGQRR